MDAFILPDIPFKLSRKALMKKLHIKEGTRDAEEFQQLADQAHKIARPKALYRTCFKDTATDDTVTIDEVTFRSRVLTVNIENANRVFAYSATCGTEVED